MVAVASDEARFLIQPQDGAAVIQIGKSIYLVREGVKPDGFLFWTFRTKKGGIYTVDRRGIGMGCTCPDRMFRRHECKHTRAVRVLYGIGETVPRDLIAAGLKY